MPKSPLSLLASARPSGQSLGLNVLLITGGAVLIYAGINDISVVDAALGRGGGGAAASTTAGGGAQDTAVAPTTAGTTTFDGITLSSWIATELQWARDNGWGGKAISGVRSKSEQLAAANHYGLSHYGSGGALGSNHYIGNGVNYPHGAVDVTEPAQLAAVLSRKPGGSPLKWGNPVIGDYSHFSATGH